MYQCITQSMHPTPCYMKLSLSWKKVIGSEVDAISHMEWYQDTDWEQSMHSRIQLQYKNLYLFLSNYITVTHNKNKSENKNVLFAFWVYHFWFACVWKPGSHVWFPCLYSPILTNNFVNIAKELWPEFIWIFLAIPSICYEIIREPDMNIIIIWKSKPYILVWNFLGWLRQSVPSNSWMQQLNSAW